MKFHTEQVSEDKEGLSIRLKGLQRGKLSQTISFPYNEVREYIVQHPQKSTRQSGLLYLKLSQQIRGMCVCVCACVHLGVLLYNDTCGMNAIS